MLCQDNYEWPSGTPAIDTSDNCEPEKMQFTTTGENFDQNMPSTSNSDSNVRVLGFKLTIDEDTMNNLHSFYQNNVTQHDFISKMPKLKKNKRRVNHYQHEICKIAIY